MKHTVHVTVTYSVEIDDTELKREFGKTSKKLIKTIAMNKPIGNIFDSRSEIVESYDNTVKVKRGIGSY